MSKDRNSELSMIVLLGGLLSLVLIGIDIWYSNWGGMWADQPIGSLAVLIHLVIVFCWYLTLTRWEDPNFDIARKWLIGLLFAACIGVGLYRAINNEDKQVLKDAKKAKQEQQR